jgi:hypothetical protein
MDSELRVIGQIVDSWAEPSGPPARSERLVLQVRPRGSRPGDILMLEVPRSLLPDAGWLQDLGENMCHGSPVAAVGRLTRSGLIAAREIRLDR